VKLLAVEKRIVEGTVRLSGWVKGETGRELELYFAFPEDLAPFVSDRADAFVPALLVPSMLAGDPLEIEPPVSRRLRGQLPLIQEVLGGWFADAMRPVPVASREREAGARSAGNGAFFSLGLDSFHTLLRHEPGGSGSERITHLIYMAGFERSLRKGGERPQLVAERVARVAQRLGKRAICGETNLRDVFEIDWGLHYHGAALAAVSLALAGGLGRVLIPSSFPWVAMQRWASSPVLDPLWSSEEVEIVHDGTGSDRAEKAVEILRTHPELLGQLRVCNRSGGGIGNCGVCEKCVRTMVTLEIAGALRGNAAFPNEIPRDFWRYFELKASGAAFEEDNLRLARTLNAAPWIVHGLERSIRTARFEMLRQEVGTLRFVRGFGEWAWERSFGAARKRLRRGRLRKIRLDVVRSATP
jgi:hypothetical protein